MLSEHSRKAKATYPAPFDARSQLGRIIHGAIEGLKVYRRQCTVLMADR